MPLIVLTFDNVNNSLQVGDIIYCSVGGTNVGGFNSTQLSNTNLIGPVNSIVNNTPLPGWDITINHTSGAPAPLPGDFISFVKDKRANTSSLIGYYANARFVNDSKTKAELFSVGSEISESSK
tara:strand:- start:1136 stop:1504 length:369 start_codon:yes stop_codon:yes gene_type:complete